LGFDVRKAKQFRMISDATVFIWTLVEEELAGSL
jgi:hypothetical protein